MTDKTPCEWVYYKGAVCGFCGVVQGWPCPRKAQRAEAVASNAEWLSTLQCSSFHLTRDDEHAPNYATAKEWIEEYQPKDFTDVDPVELQAMKDTNTIWCLQIYPNTPVGFNIWYGATMDSVIAQARRDYMNPVR